MVVADHVKPAVDALSIGAMVATLFKLLPAIAALLSIVWTVIRIYETDTIQKLVRKLRGRGRDADKPN